MDTSVERFIKYLRPFHGNAVVGKRRLSDSCPLALWYRSQGLENVSVGVWKMHYKLPNDETNETQERDLSGWELLFRNKVDELDGKKSGKVTAAEARRHLESMEVL